MRRALDPFRSFAGGSGQVAIQVQLDRLLIRYELVSAREIVFLFPIGVVAVGAMVYQSIRMGQSTTNTVGSLLLITALAAILRWNQRRWFSQYLTTPLRSLTGIEAERNAA